MLKEAPSPSRRGSEHSCGDPSPLPLTITGRRAGAPLGRRLGSAWWRRRGAGGRRRTAGALPRWRLLGRPWGAATAGGPLGRRLGAASAGAPLGRHWSAAPAGAPPPLLGRRWGAAAAGWSDPGATRYAWGAGAPPERRRGAAGGTPQLGARTPLGRRRRVGGARSPSQTVAPRPPRVAAPARLFAHVGRGPLPRLLLLRLPLLLVLLPQSVWEAPRRWRLVGLWVRLPVVLRAAHLHLLPSRNKRCRRLHRV